MTTMKAVPATCTTSHRAALAQVRAELKQRFFERDDVVDGLLTAILAQLHVVLLGPPGTAKSALVNALVERIDGAESFQWLLTKFTTPEELFGPISLKALQQDRFQRITAGKLPEAHVAFTDETFKASSAILNALLTLMNERVFHDDGQARTCPLMTLVGASNELPEGEELDALFDRFLLRFWVPYLAEQRNVRRLLSTTGAAAQASITLDELAACQREVAQVALPDALFDSLLTLKARTEEQGFRASDRRWRQVVDLLKARAYLDGDDEVTRDYLDVLADVLWQQPKDRPALATLVGAVGNPLNVRANEVLDAVREALLGLGTVEGHDASAKADWLKAASLAESRLSAMERELDELVNDNPKRRLDRVREVRRAIGDMRQDVTRRPGCEFVLTDAKGEPWKRDWADAALRRQCRRAGLREISWHKLRHTFCSHLAMQGAPPKAIMELARHTSLGVTQRYMHLCASHRSEAIALLDKRPVGDPFGHHLGTTGVPKLKPVGTTGS